MRPRDFRMKFHTQMPVPLTALLLAAVSFGCADIAVPPDTATQERPNVLLIVADDVGFSDVGAYGGEIATPNIDGSAGVGILFTQFHVAPNCGPTRGSLLTGVDYHRAGMGGNPEVTADNQKGPARLPGSPARRRRHGGGAAAGGGLSHLHGGQVAPGPRRPETCREGAASSGPSRCSTAAPATGPTRRRSFRAARPATPKTTNRWTSSPRDFYSTTVYTERIIEYIAESTCRRATVLRLPLLHRAAQSPARTGGGHREVPGRYDAGWDALAAERTERLRQFGSAGESQTPHPRPEWVLAWDELTPEQQAGRARDMEVYAAMIDYYGPEHRSGPAAICAKSASTTTP